MSNRTVVLSAVTALFLGALYFLYRPDTPRCAGCNVFVISLDQVRADSLPCFGYGQDTMPNLCRFASENSVFTNTYATASRTMDSHASMLTGLYPSVHRMNIPYASSLPEGIPYLPELMKRAGYSTYFLGPLKDPHLPLSQGLSRGFDRTFEADTPEAWMSSLDRIASESAVNGKPSMYFLHTYEAHEPWIPNDDLLKKFYTGPVDIDVTYDEICRYTLETLRSRRPELAGPPDPAANVCEQLFAYTGAHSETFEEFDDSYSIFNARYWSKFEGLPFDEKRKYMHARYSAALFDLDRRLGKFFEYLSARGMLDSSVIMIVGDQGDEFGEHGEWSHGGTLYREVLRVPLIVSVPGREPARSDRLASTVDMLPTVLGIAGIPLRARVHGRSLFGRETHDMVVAEHPNAGIRAMMTDAYAAILSPSGEGERVRLFDMRSDPAQQQSVAGDHPDIVRQMTERYRSVIGSVGTYSAEPGILPTWMTEPDRNRLIESGYF